MKITRAPDPELVKCSGLGLESPRLGTVNSVQVPKKKHLVLSPIHQHEINNTPILIHQYTNTIQVDCENAGSSFLFAAILGPNNRQGQVPKYSVCSLGQKTVALKYSALLNYGDVLLAGSTEVFGQPEVSHRFPSEKPTQSKMQQKQSNIIGQNIIKTAQIQSNLSNPNLSDQTKFICFK